MNVPESKNNKFYSYFQNWSSIYPTKVSAIIYFDTEIYSLGSSTKSALQHLWKYGSHKKQNVTRKLYENVVGRGEIDPEATLRIWHISIVIISKFLSRSALKSTNEEGNPWRCCNMAVSIFQSGIRRGSFITPSERWQNKTPVREQIYSVLRSSQLLVGDVRQRRR